MFYGKGKKKMPRSVRFNVLNRREENLLKCRYERDATKTDELKKNDYPYDDRRTCQFMWKRRYSKADFI